MEGDGVVPGVRFEVTEVRLRPLADESAVRPVREYAAAPLPPLTFAEVLAEARAWQPEAEAVIELLVPPGGKTTTLARRAGLVVTVYGRLRDVALRLPASPAQREAVLLLTYHQRLLHEALRLGFAADSPGRERAAAHFRGGLGEPASRLVALYIDVARGRTCGTAQGSAWWPADASAVAGVEVRADTEAGVELDLDAPEGG
jgi:hypothetical protein